MVAGRFEVSTPQASSTVRLRYKSSQFAVKGRPQQVPSGLVIRSFMASAFSAFL